MLTPRVIESLGLLQLQSKTHASETSRPKLSPSNNTEQSKQTPQHKPTDQSTNTNNSMKAVKLDKNEFRLLVKMLQAINHDCTYDHISYDGQTVTYQHPNKSLVFSDISLPDTKQIMNLSSLHDLLKDPALKRDVWEKLKTLK